MRIVLGVSASIAIYKACDLTRELTKLGHEVQVIMTRKAAHWISPVLFGALSNQKPLVDDEQTEMAHITVRQDTDLMLVAPATADLIARAAQGRADDILTATLLSFAGKKIFAPAMNPYMYAHPATQENLKKLKSYDYEIISPVDGEAVCGDVGEGKMAKVSAIIDFVQKIRR